MRQISQLTTNVRIVWLRPPYHNSSQEARWALHSSANWASFLSTLRALFVHHVSHKMFEQWAETCMGSSPNIWDSRLLGVLTTLVHKLISNTSTSRFYVPHILYYTLPQWNVNKCFTLHDNVELPISIGTWVRCLSHPSSCLHRLLHFSFQGRPPAWSFECTTFGLFGSQGDAHTRTQTHPNPNKSKHTPAKCTFRTCFLFEDTKPVLENVTNTHTCLMTRHSHVAIRRRVSVMHGKGKAMGQQQVFLEQSMNNLRSTSW